MKRPKICAVLVTGDPAAARRVAPAVDLYELRLDLIGEGWEELAGQIAKPWMATNRTTAEGGGWTGTEAARIDRLVRASQRGAAIVDIELATEGLAGVINMIKPKAKCLLSYHNLEGTPPLDELRDIVRRQRQAGADISKVVTTARSLADSLTVLQLVSESGPGIVAFAMGTPGLLSRVLCPLAGGEFTYASVAAGRESAPGQLTVSELSQIYRTLS
ncbi:MAG: type I 3-dehydroquinate dehydratase [Chloroflexota bacterium]